VKVVEKGFITGTSMGNMVETNIMYVGVGVSLVGYETKVIPDKKFSLWL
jgi:hypothetical protein